MADEFIGRTIVVTAGAHGQGATEAEILVREGAGRPGPSLIIGAAGPVVLQGHRTTRARARLVLSS
jgi:hypothetical protein